MLVTVGALEVHKVLVSAHLHLLQQERMLIVYTTIIRNWATLEFLAFIHK